MPTPGTSATPGLRPGLGKPPAMDPLVNQAGRASPLVFCFIFPFPGLTRRLCTPDAISPWIWNALDCLPPSYPWKAVIRNRCLSLGSAAVPCLVSDCLHLAFFPPHPLNNRNPRDLIKLPIIFPHITSLRNYHRVSEFANTDQNGQPKCASCSLELDGFLLVHPSGIRGLSVSRNWEGFTETPARELVGNF